MLRIYFFIILFWWFEFVADFSDCVNERRVVRVRLNFVSERGDEAVDVALTEPSSYSPGSYNNGALAC